MKIRSDIKELLTKVMKVHIVHNGQYAGQEQKLNTIWLCQESTEQTIPCLVESPQGYLQTIGTYGTEVP